VHGNEGPTIVEGIAPLLRSSVADRRRGGLAYLVFDTLFAMNDRWEPQPQMVESWTRSPDGLVWIFILRDGLLWHDGTAVTAEDCVASLRRWGARDALGGALLAATASLEALDVNRRGKGTPLAG
jgi:peptide/nickel transport system substrate-binding protein